MVELVDTTVLDAVDESYMGSSPITYMDGRTGYWMHSSVGRALDF